MMNPIIRKDIHIAMRTQTYYLLITLYTVLMAVVLAVSIWSWQSLDSFDPQSVSRLYVLSLYVQKVLIAVMVTAMAASAISGERERQTLDLLLVTRLSPIRIVLGKLGSALSRGALLMVAALPVLSIYSYFGALSIATLFAGFASTLLGALHYGSVGLYFSSTAKKTSTAVIMTILFIIVMRYVLTFFLFLLSITFPYFSTWLLTSNPILLVFRKLLSKTVLTVLLIYLSAYNLNHMRS